MVLGDEPRDEIAERSFRKELLVCENFENLATDLGGGKEMPGERMPSKRFDIHFLISSTAAPLTDVFTNPVEQEFAFPCQVRPRFYRAMRAEPRFPALSRLARHERELRHFVRANLAHFKAPQRVTLVKEIPKTATARFRISF